MNHPHAPALRYIPYVCMYSTYDTTALMICAI